MRAGGSQGSVAVSQQPNPSMTREDELVMLKQQTETMAQQMQQVQERIRQLEQEDS